MSLLATRDIIRELSLNYHVFSFNVQLSCLDLFALSARWCSNLNWTNWANDDQVCNQFQFQNRSF